MRFRVIGNMVGTERYHGHSNAKPDGCMRIIGLVTGFVLLMCTASAQTQPLGEKRTTTSGNVVTVYSIAWPTPVSSVTADVEVCASPNAPPYTFAFPSFFSFGSRMAESSRLMAQRRSLRWRERRSSPSSAHAGGSISL